MAMQNRRKFMLILTTGLVALTFVVGSTLADELIGYITKVDVAAKKLTVVEKDTDKEIEVTTTADTEWVTKKETTKIDLEKIEKQVTKVKDAGKKGVSVTVTHEKGGRARRRDEEALGAPSLRIELAARSAAKGTSDPGECASALHTSHGAALAYHRDSKKGGHP